MAIGRRELKKIYAHINSIIEEEMLKPDGSIRGRGWGLLEMKSCALYLRMMPLELIDDNKIELLKVIQVEDKYLGYEFFLKKIKQAFILNCSDFKLGGSIDGPFQKKCRKWGIQTETDCSSLANLLSKNLEHEFFVFIGKEEQFFEIQEEYSGVLPHRQIFINSLSKVGEKQVEELKSHVISGDLNAFRQLLFSDWTNSMSKRVGKPILVFGDVKQSEDKKNFERKDISHAIIYDRHGELLIDKKEKGWGFTMTKEEAASCLYYELYHGKDITAWIIKDISKYPYKHFELLAAGLIDVLVIDERIQKSIENSWTDYIEVGNSRQVKMEKLDWMGIHILDNDTVQLNKSGKFSKENEGKKILSWISKRIKPERPQYLVIHLGIIEKIVGTKIEKVNEWVENLLTAKQDDEKYRGIFLNRSTNHALFKKIIIVTGRGRIHKLSKKIHYVHYSNLAKYIVEDTSKVHLCQVLLSTRRTY